MCHTFVIDLDGTLLANDGKLRLDVCDYLVQLQKRGYTVVIATGRKNIEAQQIITQLKLEEYKNAVILSDGQYLLDYRDGTTTVGPFLAYPDDYVEIVNGFGGAAGAVKLITPDQDYDVFPSALAFGACSRFFKYVIKRRNPFKGVLVNTQKTVEGIEKITYKPCDLSTRPDATLCERYQAAFVNDKGRFEFKAKSVNKFYALMKYIGKYNIKPENVAVFGNDENDICLFEQFSNSFAVDTAPQNVQEQAGDVIPYDEGVGVIKKIESIIEGGKQ